MPELHVSAEQRERLLATLLRITDLYDPDVRQLYLTELQSRLGRTLSVRPFDNPQHALWAIVTACSTDFAAMNTLFRVLQTFHGDHPAIPDLNRLVEELRRPPLLTPDQRRELVSPLNDVAPDSLREAFQIVLGDQVGRGGEPDWHATMEVVRRAEQASLRAGGLALLLTFAEQAGHRSSDAIVLDQIHAWVSTVGRVGEIDGAVLQGLCPAGRRATALAEAPLLDGGARPRSADSGELDDTTDPKEAEDEPQNIGEEEVAAASMKQPVQLLDAIAPVRGNLPIRNTDFTGRGPLLSQLRSALVNRSNASVVPQTLHGLGGVGKTQLTVEYVYRHIDSYHIVWWINADHATSVRTSLAELGRELDIPPSTDLNQTAATVLNYLAGSPRPWLLVYDNANQPEDLSGLLPATGGHVVITSRNEDWTNVYDAIEVDVLHREESVELIRRKVGPAITDKDADRLADKVGDLPLALEQAAAWHSVTGMAVDRYLELFDAHVEELMGENKPANYPTSVSAFLRVAFDKLREGTVPEAPQLLELFAYLGPDPVSATLLRSGRGPGISTPLQDALTDEITMNRAIRELGRHGLAKVQPRGQKIQVHRLVQLVLREGLLDRRRVRSLNNVRLILAAVNPGDPDNPDNWPRHAEIGPHIEQADLLGAHSDEARKVALDQARYLFRIGDYTASRDLAEKMVARWSTAPADGGLGPDHEHTLLASRHLANALRQLGSYERAKEIDAKTLTTLRESPAFGEYHEHTVAVGLGFGYDLRLSGDIAAAHQADEENYARALETYQGDDHPDSLTAKNNVAASLRMLGDFEGAYQRDKELVDQWTSIVGENDARTLWAISNVARDLYGLGRYADALAMQEEALPAHISVLGASHHDVLQATRTIAIALRKSGRYGSALSQARETYHAYRTRFGPEHEHALAATMTFANTLRAVGQFTEARDFAVDGVDTYRKVFGPRHPLSLAASTNLGIILRALGQLRDARRLEEATYQQMREVLGEEHPYTLCVAGNYANSLVLAGDTATARQITTEVMDASMRVRGATHPYSLTCALNAALDLRNSGDEEAGDRLFDETIQQLRATLGEDHPETLHASQDRRADFDIEPPPM